MRAAPGARIEQMMVILGASVVALPGFAAALGMVTNAALLLVDEHAQVLEKIAAASGLPSAAGAVSSW